jgi:hypothetical protein
MHASDYDAPFGVDNFLRFAQINKSLSTIRILKIDKSKTFRKTFVGSGNCDAGVLQIILFQYVLNVIFVN